jgi:hypothetical protein
MVYTHSKDGFVVNVVNYENEELIGFNSDGEYLEIWDGLQGVGDVNKTTHNLSIEKQIQDVELNQPRAMREVALNISGGVERLQAIDDQISALRAMFI